MQLLIFSIKAGGLLSANSGLCWNCSLQTQRLSKDQWSQEIWTQFIFFFSFHKEKSAVTIKQWKWKSLSHVHRILQARILEWVASILLQEIFPSQGLNPGLPHWRRILNQLSHKGSPRILEWAYPFSSRSSQARNQTRVFCITSDSLPTELWGKQ